MTKKRNIYLDVIKAINIMLVVFGHCIQLGAGNEYSAGEFYENPIFMFIYSFHMPLFFYQTSFTNPPSQTLCNTVNTYTYSSFLRQTFYQSLSLHSPEFSPRK